MCFVSSVCFRVPFVRAQHLLYALDVLRQYPTGSRKGMGTIFGPNVLRHQGRTIYAIAPASVAMAIATRRPFVVVVVLVALVGGRERGVWAGMVYRSKGTVRLQCVRVANVFLFVVLGLTMPGAIAAKGAGAVRTSFLDRYWHVSIHLRFMQDVAVILFQYIHAIAQTLGRAMFPVNAATQ